MSGILIESSNSKNLKLLAELAEQLGEKVTLLAFSEVDDRQWDSDFKNEKGEEELRQEIEKGWNALASKRNVKDIIASKQK